MNLILGDCLEKLKELPDNSIDAVVTDPPYGISFMAKKWDYDVPKVEVWQEVLRVLKPGGHALVACGTRTQHRMAVNLEDAGFEIRDIVAWIYGSGFPKSLNIGIAVDKLQGNERKVIGKIERSTPIIRSSDNQNYRKWHDEKRNDKGLIEFETTEGFSQFEGWGTALKPAMELFTLCRKPLSEKNIAENCLKWGTGGINVDGCRVGSEKIIRQQKQTGTLKFQGTTYHKSKTLSLEYWENTNGRFPANLIHDGSDEVLDIFPYTKSGARKSTHNVGGGDEYSSNYGIYGKYRAKPFADSPASEGNASRFFYCAKANKKERNLGLEGFEANNFHPTVKPIALMSYLCRLITPPNGIILDPFMGSGSTGCGAVKEGFNFTGIEIDPEYFKIAEARILYHSGTLFNPNSDKKE